MQSTARKIVQGLVAIIMDQLITKQAPCPTFIERGRDKRFAILSCLEIKWEVFQSSRHVLSKKNRIKQQSPRSSQPIKNHQVFFLFELKTQQIGVQSSVQYLKEDLTLGQCVQDQSHRVCYGTALGNRRHGNQSVSRVRRLSLLPPTPQISNSLCI